MVKFLITTLAIYRVKQIGYFVKRKITFLKNLGKIDLYAIKDGKLKRFKKVFHSRNKRIEKETPMQNKSFFSWIITITISLTPHLFFAQTSNHTKKKPKIVALVPARNESFLIEQCLRGLALYADAIIVLDDASEDNTVEIVKSIAKECKVEKIIKRKKWHRDEPFNRSRLFQAARDSGATHIIFVDADEMFTADCLKNDFLRKKILALKPGDTLVMPWIPIWRDVYKFRQDRGVPVKPFACCDDGTCSYGGYGKQFIHTGRFPKNLSGKQTLVKTHGVLHFQAVNIRNMGIRKAWYICIEQLRYPDLSLESRNNRYDHMTNEKGLRLTDCPKRWYEGYAFFDGSIYEKIDTYRRAQIYKWFDEHGFELFSDLDLSCLSDNFGK